MFEFGEVREPTTRAFWENYDEEIEETSPEENLQLMWTLQNAEKPLTKLPPNGYKVLILDGQLITEFATKIFDLSKWPSAQTASSTVSVHHLLEQQLVVFVCDCVQLELASRCTELMSPWLQNASDVITVSVLSNAEHKAGNNDDKDSPCFVRAIGANSIGVKDLELPNLISGVCAGVATWRICQKKSSAINLVFYIDKPKLDVMNSKLIIETIKKLGLSCKDQFVSSQADYSNLYT